MVISIFSLLLFLMQLGCSRDCPIITYKLTLLLYNKDTDFIQIFTDLKQIRGLKQIVN